MKPKNYWLMAYIANGVAISLLIANSLPLILQSISIILVSVLLFISIILGGFWINKSAEPKDRKYLIWGLCAIFWPILIPLTLFFHIIIGPIILIFSILCIVQSIKYKDLKYFLLGISPLIIYYIAFRFFIAPGFIG